MTEPPRLHSLLAFVLGFGLLLCIAEGPLWALVGPEARLLDRVNVVRRAHHLKPFAASAELAGVARAHAEDMARRGYFSHTAPDGTDALDRVRAAGVDGFRLLAENLGVSNVSDDRIAAVIDAWLASPSHRENLLNPAFNTTGIGVAQAADGSTLYVQLFATFTE